MLVLIVGLVSTAQLLAVSAVALADAGVVTAATLDAEDVLDELAAAGFAAPALQVSATDTLGADVDGYVNHSAAGRTRRWQIEEGPVAGTRVVRVRVLSPGARRYGGHIELRSMVRRP